MYRDSLVVLQTLQIVYALCVHIYAKAIGKSWIVITFNAIAFSDYLKTRWLGYQVKNLPCCCFLDVEPVYGSLPPFFGLLLDLLPDANVSSKTQTERIPVQILINIYQLNCDISCTEFC